jgi:PIN domain nuclease of toxin-antitoxin system
MVVFIDTSSLLKRYIEENGSTKVDTYYSLKNTLFISPVTILEVNSALNRKVNDETINEETYEKAISF